MNTTGYSAGRVCFPSQRDAISAICTGRRGGVPSALTRSQWWPGKKPDRPDLRRALRDLLAFPEAQRDYMPVEGPR